MPLTSMATPVAQVPVPPAAPAAPQVHVVPEKNVSNSSLTGFFASFDPIMRPIANVCSTMREIRRSLALPNLGTVEKMQNEVKMVQTANFQFEGARASPGKWGSC